MCGNAIIVNPETDMSTQLHQFGIAPMVRQPQPRLALLTLDQVAEMLGTSKAWVRDHATRRNPRIPCVRLGGRRALLRFRLQDVEAFIDKHLICTEDYA
jgi:hypothetical protein